MMLITAIKRCSSFSKKFGFIKALKLFYFLYYGKFKGRTIDISKEKIISTKTNCKLYVVPNDPGISFELSVYRIHEPITTEIISKKLKENMVCVDVGANIGYYATLESKKIGKNGKVIAIEPSPIAFDYLQKNLDSQNTSNYDLYNHACSDVDSSVNFLIHEKSNISKIVKEIDIIPAGMKIIPVQTKKLDTILNNEHQIDFLRMDIEGHELRVIQGAINTIKKFKPIIQIELHSEILGYANTKKFLQLFREEDYVITSFMIRELDTPFVGTIKDSKNNYSINDLFSMLETNNLPPFTQLFLEPRDYN